MSKCNYIENVLKNQLKIIQMGKLDISEPQNRKLNIQSIYSTIKGSCIKIELNKSKIYPLLIRFVIDK